LLQTEKYLKENEGKEEIRRKKIDKITGKNIDEE